MNLRLSDPKSAALLLHHHILSGAFHIFNRFPACPLIKCRQWTNKVSIPELAQGRARFHDRLFIDASKVLSGKGRMPLFCAYFIHEAPGEQHPSELLGGPVGSEENSKS